MRRKNALVTGSVLSALAVISCLGPNTPGMAGMACPQLRGSGAATYSAQAKANATIQAFVQASGEVSAMATQMEAEIAMACQRIGADLGVPASEMQPENTEGGKASGACRPVLARIDAILKAGAQARLDVTFQPPECRVEANAYASCAAQCQVNVDPGYIIAHCEPGKLEGQCQGTCRGHCEATCNGACSGECSAKNAAGQCAGYCKGECGGQCTGTCHAKCEGTWQAPRCNVDAKAPSVDARCEASCKAHAEVSAQCTDAKVDIKAQAQGMAEMGKLIDTLRVNLPILIKAQIGYGERLISAVGTLIDVGADLPKVVGEATAQGVACMTAASSLAVHAQASVRVSVQASASVSGRVTGSGGT